MSDWKDLDVRTYDAGYGRFLEIALRTNNQTTGLAISGGEFVTLKDGSRDKERKTYKSRVFIGLNDGSKEWILTNLKELLAKL